MVAVDITSDETDNIDRSIETEHYYYEHVYEAADTEHQAACTAPH